MSTILKALEKNKGQAAMSSVQPVTNTGLKVAIISALVLIAILLGIVIYLLLRPSQSTPVLTVTPAIETITPALEATMLGELVDVPRQTDSRVTEVQFKTIPLPIREAPAPSWGGDDIVMSEAIDQDPRLPEQVVETGVTAQSKLDLLKQTQQDQKVLSDIDLDNVPDSLKQRFALAVEEEKNGVLRDQIVEQNPQQVMASDIHEMPNRFQDQIPSMRYDSHVYSSDEADRWIRINGVDMRVGDFVGDIELVDILPQQSVFRLGAQSFTLESLQDWKD